MKSDRAFRRVYLAILSLMLTAVFPNTVFAADPVVRLKSGALSGKLIDDEMAAFQGIPYAAPPIGKFRWREPQSVPQWQGELKADSYRNACTQNDAGWNTKIAATSSEDCLYLNVWTPKLDASANLPVMVWIHGGAFTGGAGGDSSFDGDQIAARGVVLVTLNYRLDVFGFFAHPELSAESKHKVSGNYGLLDQQAALRWVQKNIKQFGGDPKAVTIFGQSAGGMSVTSQLTSPLAKDLARSAIIQSGSVIRPTPMTTLQEAEALGFRFSKEGFSKEEFSKEEFSKEEFSSEELATDKNIAQLRQQSTEDLLKNWTRFASIPPRSSLGPVVDNYVLLEDPFVSFAKQRQHSVSLMIGNNAREGFVRVKQADFENILRDYYSDSEEKALAVYGFADKNSVGVDPVLGNQAAQWATDTSLRCGAVITASEHNNKRLPVYAYQFEQSIPGRESMGAAHSFELPYVFGVFKTEGIMGAAYTEEDRALSDLMVNYWTNFAKQGNPNGTGLPDWPRFIDDTRAYQQFATRFESNTNSDKGLRRSACELFEKKIKSEREDLLQK